MFLNLLFRHIEGQVPQKQYIMPLLLLLFLLFRNLIIRFAFWLCFGFFLFWFLFYWLLCWCDISTGLPLLWTFWFRLCRDWGDCSEDEALATLNNLCSIRNFFYGPRFCVLFWILWKKIKLHIAVLTFFIQENTFENIVCKILAILSRPHVKWLHLVSCHLCDHYCDYNTGTLSFSRVTASHGNPLAINLLKSNFKWVTVTWRG